jgi:hypothetical protein
MDSIMNSSVGRVIKHTRQHTFHHQDITCQKKMIVKQRGHDITLGIIATCYIEQGFNVRIHTLRPQRQVHQKLRKGKKAVFRLCLEIYQRQPMAMPLGGNSVSSNKILGYSWLLMDNN